uniref:Uncharacterized protein n=1 Tax=Chromera velia CCMP2878 TaxID=1169474 RepID=A0A0G4GUB4_9ALVE|eukprot:Cvel_23391.t1-p1 / transcript=Cvel_23391.t1 / gene=Cvel_23391 / organism=Chromera_velia_CCMP2878 / gene_product=hypothetical protein / transcript_product=hypothetical protein / location=Cvel_scaffold2404:20780-21331(+) / protein_length=184 / sequence_SO=supercontig / SO=protein_coding / is_pseudo=false
MQCSRFWKQPALFVDPALPYERLVVLILDVFVKENGRSAETLSDHPASEDELCRLMMIPGIDPAALFSYGKLCKESIDRLSKWQRSDPGLGFMLATRLMDTFDLATMRRLFLPQLRVVGYVEGDRDEDIEKWLSVAKLERPLGEQQAATVPSYILDYESLLTDEHIAEARKALSQGDKISFEEF